MSTQNKNEFLQKTNTECMIWMESFFHPDAIPNIDRYCTWAWQEQERRHNAIEDDLLEALEACSKELRLMIDRYNVRNFVDGSYTYDHQTVFEADAIIARARGES